MKDKLIQELEGLRKSLTGLESPYEVDKANGWNDAISEVIDVIKQHNQWISVEDRLPKLTEDSGDGMQSVAVLCLHNDGHHEDCVCHEDIDGGIPYWYYVQDGEYCDTVTHWMPLPPKQ